MKKRKFSPWNEAEVSQQELQEYIDSLSWATVSWSGENIDVADIISEIQ